MAYVVALQRHVIDYTVRRVFVPGISVLKTFEPPIESIEGQHVVAVHRMGKRVVFELGNENFLVMHLMIAGRLFWKKIDAKPGRDGLVVIRFDHGALHLREVAKKKRARVWLHASRASMVELHQREGLEPLTISQEQFAERIRAENRTLKRALTDPRIFSGIGNAYSDEILLYAQLSPVKRTLQLSDEEIVRLFESTQAVLREWIERLQSEFDKGWPKKVTAFRSEMAVHGKFGKPCRICKTTVERIVYAENEVNYCPGCQTNGRILADRSLSRLLKSDWPKTLDEMEGFRQ